MRIGELAKTAGVSVQTLRFYERRRLLRKPRRGANGYRQYTDQDLEIVVTIRKAKIRNSVIRSGVTIEDDVTVEDSIIMEDVVLRKGCRLRRVIVDKHNVIEEGEEFGFDPDQDRFKCHLDASGICIIPKGGKKGRRPKA